MKKTIPTRMVALILIAAIGLSACGSGARQDPAATPASSATTAPTQTEPVPTVSEKEKEHEKASEEKGREELTSTPADKKDDKTESDESEDDFPYKPKYEVTYDKLNTGYARAVSQDGRYRVHSLADGHDGSPVYVYDTATGAVHMIEIPVGISYPYVFGRDNIVIAVGIHGLIFCDPQTGKIADGFIDFDYKGQTIIGLCYDPEEEQYIAVWREYGLHPVTNLGPIPEDEDPAIVQRMSEGYYPVRIMVFDKEGTRLWEKDTELTIIGGLQNFVITVDVQVMGDGMVRIADFYMRDGEGKQIEEAQASYRQE